MIIVSVMTEVEGWGEVSGSQMHLSTVTITSATSVIVKHLPFVMPGPSACQALHGFGWVFWMAFGNYGCRHVLQMYRSNVLIQCSKVWSLSLGKKIQPVQFILYSLKTAQYLKMSQQKTSVAERWWKFLLILLRPWHLNPPTTLINIKANLSAYQENIPW